MLSALENRRKAVHLLFGIFTAAAVYSGMVGAAELLFIVIAGVIISFASRVMDIPVISWFIAKLERDDAKKNFSGKGPVYFFAGSLLSVLFFEKNIALASIAILALGDSVAPLVGQFGRIRHPMSADKTLEGLAAGVAAAFAGAALFVSPLEALAAGACAMLAEGADIKFAGNKLDDNLVIPLVAGSVITAIRILG